MNQNKNLGLYDQVKKLLCHIASAYCDNQTEKLFHLTSMMDRVQLRLWRENEEKSIDRQSNRLTC